MNNGYIGALIARERLQRNWSMEGLCKGICTVSYLSKIESGKAEPSQEILQLLLAKLDIAVDETLEREAQQKAETAWSLLLDGCPEQFAAFVQQDAAAQKYRATQAGLDWLLFFCLLEERPVQPQMEAYMDTRQLALQRVLQGRVAEAVALQPIAYFYWQAALFHYSGGNYAAALQQLQMGYDLAARDGAVHLMLLCKVYMGNIYSNQMDNETMQQHYAVAYKIAQALGEETLLEQLRYNEAASWIETGQYERAYEYFAQLHQHSVMSLHKFAICCEMTSRREEALQVLDVAAAMRCDYPPQELAQLMCDVVRFRLLHEDYLQQPQYGELLMRCFESCRAQLPTGYAAFHLPWVLQWLKATRQYKKALEIAETFPINRS